MQITQHPNARSFLDATRALLDPYQAEAGLIYGLALRQIDVEIPDPADNLFISMCDEDGRPIFAVARMGRPGVLIFGDPERYRSYAEEVLPGIRRFHPEIAALHGPEETVMAVLRADGQGFTTKGHQGLYRLDELIPARPSQGQVRKATLADFDIVADWGFVFESEAMGQSPDRATLEIAMRSRIEQGVLWVWENGGPVSMAVHTRPTGRGVCIGYVFTPEEHRGHGYASNLTEAVSRAMLEDERFEFCTLFTDMSNPTSNKIYQSIGYYKIVDFIYTELLA